MFEQYFNFLKTPFARDIPEKDLYNNTDIEEVCDRLKSSSQEPAFRRHHRRCRDRQDHSHT